MSALILGARGQLARHVRELLPDARFWGRRERSLDDPDAVEAAIVEAAPSVIVNAAAYTAVDRAEGEPQAAWRVNAEGAACAARAAARLRVPIIHVSTDYVFDGDSDRHYLASDPTRPINVYGRTKLAGELAVISICPKHWILRTSWLFSEFQGNFVTTMLRLANERDGLRVVADQRGRPTYAGDVARVIATLVTGQVRQTVSWGIHHLGGGKAVSWHQFAEIIISSGRRQGLIKRLPRLDAITSEDYPVPARRPRNSVLEPSRALESALDFEPDWQAGLDAVLVRLRPSGSR